VPSSPPAPRSDLVPVLLIVLLWVGLATVLFGAGELVTHWRVVDQFDRHVTVWVVAHRSHALNTTMKVITWGGSWVAVATTGGILLVLVTVRKLPLGVVILAAAGWAGEAGAVNLVKTLVDRQRPPQNVWLVMARGSSFPSGHAANATLVFGTVAFVWCILADSWTVRIVGLVVSALGVLAVGFSRVELGVHWTTDVLASYLVVSAWLVGIGLLFAYRLPLAPDVHPGRAVKDRSPVDVPTDGRHEAPHPQSGRLRS